MYHVDRRKLAVHMYSILGSLRKTAKLLMVSHSTIFRWLASPERKQYKRKHGTSHDGISHDGISQGVILEQGLGQCNNCPRN